jgi:hypothetical protein
MINKDSFVFYFMKKSGGRYDPNLLNDIMNAFEEWMPKEKPNPSIDEVPLRDYEYICENVNGWNSYRENLLENMKLKPGKEEK